jgi:hypothetical protein
VSQSAKNSSNLVTLLVIHPDVIRDEADFYQRQCGQKSSRKKWPKMYPNPFLSKLKHHLNCGTKQPKVWATCVNLRQLPKNKQSSIGRKFGHPDLSVEQAETEYNQIDFFQTKVGKNRL